PWVDCIEEVVIGCEILGPLDARRKSSAGRCTAQAWVRAALVVMSAGQVLMGMGMGLGKIDSPKMLRSSRCEAKHACLPFLAQPGRWSVRSKRPIMAMGSTYFSAA